MPNNKIVDREALKATRQAFQNALENGQIVPSKAISTKQIEAISSDSGTIQEAPFISQATGTANGTTIVDTSPVGKHLEKQGNAIVYNQLVQNGDFSDGTTGWNTNNVTFSVADNIATITADGMTRSIYNTLAPDAIVGHKYLISYTCKTDTGTVVGGYGYGAKYVTNAFTFGTTEKEYFAILEPNSTDKYFYIYLKVGTIYVKNVFMVDLTKWFNGDIPQDILDTPAHFSRYYNGDLTHNLGEIRFGAGRYLECGQSRNVWDEEWEAGTFDTITGENTSGIGIRSKNLIRVIPNVDYYGWCGSSGGFWVMFLDKDENVIPLTNDIGTVVNNVVSIRETIIKTPANAAYAKFYISSEYGTTYKHDITISLYYSTGEGYYGHYYPYVAPKIYATGTEVLRKAGTAKDIKYPNGTIIRNVGSRAYESGDETDSSVLTDGTTTYYQLAIPTTEQGTPFSENIEINDYSYMSWLDTNNLLVDVPQGCKIFYPADYVLFTDSLGQKFEWDVNNIASKDDITEDVLPYLPRPKFYDYIEVNTPLLITPPTIVGGGELDAQFQTNWCYYIQSANDGDSSHYKFRVSYANTNTVIDQTFQSSVPLYGDFEFVSISTDRLTFTMRQASAAIDYTAPTGKKITGMSAWIIGYCDYVQGWFNANQPFKQIIYRDQKTAITSGNNLLKLGYIDAGMNTQNGIPNDYNRVRSYTCRINYYNNMIILNQPQSYLSTGLKNEEDTTYINKMQMRLDNGYRGLCNGTKVIIELEEV